MFAADAVARLTGVPGVAAVTAGPGVTNTITALKNAQMAQSPLVLARRRDRDRPQGPRRAPGHRPDGAHAPARQVGDARDARARSSRRSSTRPFERPRRACPARCSSSAPVDLLYPEALVREWYGAKTGGAAGVGRGARRALVPRPAPRDGCSATWGDGARARGGVAGHARAGRGAGAPRGAPRRRGGAAGARRREPGAARRAARSAELARAPRARSACPSTSRAWRAACSAATHPLQLRHRRKEALREADLVILAGLPDDFRLDYGRHIGRRARARDREPQPRTSCAKNRRPDLAVQAAPELLPDRRSLARPAAAPAPLALVARDAARARRRARRGDRGTGRRRGRRRRSTRCALCRAIDGGLARRERRRGRRRRLRGDGVLRRAPARPALVARPRGVRHARRRARASRSARRSSRPGRGGVDPLRRRLARLQPRRVRHLRAPRPRRRSRSSATTPAGRRSRASRWRCCSDDVGTVLASTDYHERAAEGLGARGLAARPRRETPRPSSRRRAGSPRAAGRSSSTRGSARTEFRKGSISM